MSTTPDIHLTFPLFPERGVVSVAYHGVFATCTLECGHKRNLRSAAYPGLMVACLTCKPVMVSQ